MIGIIKTNKKRGRPGIKPSIKSLICEYALTKRQIPRNALAVELIELIKDKMGEAPPAEETIIKLITEARSHPKSELDLPWSLGWLSKYEIPPEALPTVLLITGKRIKESNMHLTIREALWIGRLYKIVDNVDFLELFSVAYNVRECIDFILDRKPDTEDIDVHLRRFLNKDTRPEFFRNPEIIKELLSIGWDRTEMLLEKGLGEVFEYKQ
jgi:hypothetical protein